MSSRSAAVTVAWARFIAVLCSRVYRTSLLTLSAVALAPLLFGWGSFVIRSGSMEPAIDVGDIVVARPFAIGEKVAVGRVYVFDDPSTTREHLLTHRIVEKLDDGTYTSAGDNNDVTDATPVARGDITARGVLLAPFVGLPIAWMQSGEWVKLALWLLITIAAFITAGRNLDGEPPRWTLLRVARGGTRRRRLAATPAPKAEQPQREPFIAAPRSVAPAVLGILLTLAGTGLGTANAGFTAQTKNAGWSWNVGSWTQPYVSAVLADVPAAFWLLDETAGTTTAQDRSGNRALGTYRTGATPGQAGALTARNPGTSMRTSGSLAFTSANPVAAPTVHSVELWFRTTSTAGGYIAGFGSTVGATSSTEDRTLRMTATGQLTYGDWVSNPLRAISTPRAYNDGAWHQVVVAVANPSSFGDTVIYVDGSPVTSGQTSKAAAYTGYWHIGAGSGSAAFNGTIDNVSIFKSQLSAARVAAHYAAR
jgi:signal peptidase I